jgi:hypothetical protein
VNTKVNGLLGSVKCILVGRFHRRKPQTSSSGPGSGSRSGNRKVMWIAPTVVV